MAAFEIPIPSLKKIPFFDVKDLPATHRKEKNNSSQPDRQPTTINYVSGIDHGRRNQGGVVVGKADATAAGAEETAAEEAVADATAAEAAAVAE